MRIAFIHGFTGGPAVWRRLAAPGAQTILLPGHREGTQGPRPVLPTWEANLEAIAAELTGIELVIGYSLGARVALGLVALGRVPRAISISVNPGLASEAERVERRAGDARWAALLRTEGIEAFSTAWEAQPLFATQERGDGAALEERRRARRAQDAEGLARSLETMGLAQMPDYRAAVDERVRLIVGADDAKYVAIARGLAAPVTVIEGAGHDPTLEQPARLAEAIAALRW